MSNEEYCKLINADPDVVKVSEDGSYSFIPISIIESMLDMIYDGNWSWVLERETFGKNYAAGSGILKFLHPVTGFWIERSGTAAVALSKELAMDFPRLEAACILNASKKIGAAFGRNLNRDKEDAEIPVLSVDKEERHDEQFDAVKKTMLETIELHGVAMAKSFLEKSVFKYHPGLKAILEQKNTSE